MSSANIDLALSPKEMRSPFSLGKRVLVHADLITFGVGINWPVDPTMLKSNAYFGYLKQSCGYFAAFFRTLRTDMVKNFNVVAATELVQCARSEK